MNFTFQVVRSGSIFGSRSFRLIEKRLLSSYHQVLTKCRVFASRQQDNFRNARCFHSSAKMSTDNVLEGFDATQVHLMQEECILVDKDDNNIGHATKKTCHLMENIDQDHFTNTCCSHPLNFAAELEEEGAIGVKRAAQRKLKHELGIEPSQIPLEDFHYLTRILYKADNIPKGKWGEHEIDYILFIQRDVDLKPNPNEVRSYRYVSQKELKDFIDSAEDKGILLTPWFKLIVNSFLYKWWNKLSSIQSQAETEVIHTM